MWLPCCCLTLASMLEGSEFPSESRRVTFPSSLSPTWICCVAWDDGGPWRAVEDAPNFSLKESPVPGMPALAKAPRLPKLTDAPRGPTLQLVPLLLTFSRSPGASLIDLRNLMLMLCFTPLGVVPASVAEAGVSTRADPLGKG